jgi:hypothetical protein
MWFIQKEGVRVCKNTRYLGQRDAGSQPVNGSGLNVRLQRASSEVLTVIALITTVSNYVVNAKWSVLAELFLYLVG